MYIMLSSLLLQLHLWQLLLSVIRYFMYLVVKWFWTRNQQVAGSSPGRSARPWASCSQFHTRVPWFTKQYKLVPAQAGN